MTSSAWVLAAFGIVVWLYIVRVSLKMHRQALIAQLLTGQDQMFGFLSDTLDPARPLYTPHRDKSERLQADALTESDGLQLT